MVETPAQRPTAAPKA